MTAQQKYTAEELSQHALKSDCWLQIADGIYNVSEYMDEHPGGVDVIMDSAGSDVTEMFNDIGHSKHAVKLLSNFRIGSCDPIVLEKNNSNEMGSGTMNNLLVFGGFGLLAGILLYTIFG